MKLNSTNSQIKLRGNYPVEHKSVSLVEHIFELNRDKLLNDKSLVESPYVEALLHLNEMMGFGGADVMIARFLLDHIRDRKYLKQNIWELPE